MNIENLILRLQSSGAKLRLKDERLLCEFKPGALNATLKNELISRKEEIRAFMQRTKKSLAATSGIQKYSGNKDQLPLSFAQEQFWLLSQLEGPSANCNITKAFLLRGELDSERLIKAIEALFVRHETFRTSFHFNQDAPFQTIHAQCPSKLEIVNIPRTALTAELQKHAQLKFNLSRPPLCSVRMFALDATTHALSFSVHHIIVDGWSFDRITQEINANYHSLTQDPAAPLVSSAAQVLDISDIAVHQRQIFRRDPPTQEFTEMLSFWRDYLNGAPSGINLPYDKQSNSASELGGGYLQRTLSESQIAQLVTIAKQTESTLFTVLLAALKITLHQWTGQADLVVGTVVAGRSNEYTHDIIGCLVNFLVLRNHLTPTMQTQQLLKAVTRSTLSAFSNQDCPISEVANQQQSTHNGNKGPLYNVVFRLQNQASTPLRLPGIEIEDISPESDAAQVALLFEAIEINGALHLNLEYDKNLFATDTAAQLLEFWQQILLAIRENLNSPLSDFSLPKGLITDHSAPQDTDQALNIFGTFTTEPLASTLSFWKHFFNLPLAIEFAPYNQVFQQLLNPNSIFANTLSTANIILIRWEDWAGETKQDASILERTTQDFLNTLEGALDANTAPCFIFVCPRSKTFQNSKRLCALIETTESRLTALADKAHNLHLTCSSELETTYPLADYCDAEADRLAHMPYSEQGYTAIATLVFRKLLASSRKPYKVIVLDCDNTLWGGVCAELGAENIVLNEAYLSLHKFMQQQLESGLLLCLCSKNNLSDVQEVFKTNNNMLLQWEQFVSVRINWDAKSANIAAMAEELNLGLDAFIFIDDDPVQCHEVMTNCPQVLTLQLPKDSASIPSWLQQLWALDRTRTIKKSMDRTAFYKADAQRKDSQRKFSNMHSFLETLNLEITFNPVCTESLPRAVELMQRVNQFNNSNLQLTATELVNKFDMDNSAALVVSVTDRFGDYGAVGLVIFTTAPPRLKIEKFLLSCRALGRGVEYKILNHLGEYAANQACTMIELHFSTTEKNTPFHDFLGTLVLPGQIPTSTKPYIELSSAEACEAQIANQAQQTNKTATPSPAPGPISINNQLLTKICAELHDIESIYAKSRKLESPSNQSNKITSDLNADLVREVSTIFKELLGLNKLSLEDDFFALGGNSLLAVRILSRLNQTHKLQLNLSDLLANSNIAAFIALLATKIDKPSSAHTSNLSIPQAPEEANRLSFQQKRLWVVDQMDPQNTHYNMAVSLELNGTLNRAALEQAIQKIIARHHVLRTVYFSHEQVPFQFVQESFQFILEQIDLSGEPNENQDSLFAEIYAKQKRQAFNLETDLMLRASLLKLSDTRHYLTVIIHHIACDGWSLGVLVNELSRLYTAIINAKDPALPDLPIQYRDYAHWENQLLTSTTSVQQIDFWKKELAGLPDVHNLPLDYPRPTTRSYRGDSITRQLDSNAMTKIHSYVQVHKITPFLLMQAVYISTLHKISGEHDIVVGWPTANRNHLEAEALVGFFVNNLITRVQIKSDLSFAKLIELLSSKHLAALENQQVPYEMLVKELNPPRQAAYNPLFQVCLSFQNNEQVDFELEALTLKVNPDRNIAARFDLTLNIFEIEQTMHLSWNYALDIFKAETIDAMARLYEEILWKALAKPDIALAHL